MERIKDWYDDLADGWKVVIFAIIVTCISGLFSNNFCGKTYRKMHHNNISYTEAVKEFKTLCDNGKLVDSDETFAEYADYYDNRGYAVRTFMILANRLDNLYGNGTFRHLYFGSNRVYQCCDKDRNLIAIQLVKHRASPSVGFMKPYYEIDFYVEKY